MTNNICILYVNNLVYYRINYKRSIKVPSKRVEGSQQYLNGATQVVTFRVHRIFELQKFRLHFFIVPELLDELTVEASMGSAAPCKVNCEQYQPTSTHFWKEEENMESLLMDDSGVILENCCIWQNVSRKRRVDISAELNFFQILFGQHFLKMQRYYQFCHIKIMIITESLLKTISNGKEGPFKVSRQHAPLIVFEFPHRRIN